LASYIDEKEIDNGTRTNNNQGIVCTLGGLTIIINEFKEMYKRAKKA
jgi:hypothetical protein